MKIAIGANDLLVFPETVSATGADLWKYKTNEVNNKGHVSGVDIIETIRLLDC
jgi:hypothetical protein